MDEDSPPVDNNEEEFVPEEPNASGTQEQLSEPSTGNEDDSEAFEKSSSESRASAPSQTERQSPPLRKRAKRQKAKETHSRKRGPRPSAQPSGKSDYDHRTRTTPIFLRPAQVERLIEEPGPFKAAKLGQANAWNTDTIVADKFSRAASFNIGHGPAWELLEDRSWWRESTKVPESELETEALRRPRVHQAICTFPELEVLSPK